MKSIRLSYKEIFNPVEFITELEETEVVEVIKETDKTGCSFERYQFLITRKVQQACFKKNTQPNWNSIKVKE